MSVFVSKEPVVRDLGLYLLPSGYIRTDVEKGHFKCYVRKDLSVSLKAFVVFEMLGDYLMPF